MPHPPIRKRLKHFDRPGHAHELTFSCQRRLPLLNADRTRQWLVDSIARAQRLHRFEVWAWVIMPEHVHLLLFPTVRNYSTAGILKSIKQPVARRAIDWLRANKPQFLPRLSAGLGGDPDDYRFWLQGGGYDRNVTDLDTAWQMVKYIHLNPVRRKLIEVEVEWKWSSAAAYAGRGYQHPIEVTAPN